MLLGVVPFGLIYGVLATSAGMPAWLAVAMSAIVFGGASQMIQVQLWARQVRQRRGNAGRIQCVAQVHHRHRRRNDQRGRTCRAAGNG